MKESVDIYGFKRLLEDHIIALNLILKVNAFPLATNKLTENERCSVKQFRRFLKKLRVDFDNDFIEIRKNNKRKLNDLGKYNLNKLLKFGGMPYNDFKVLYKE